MTDTPLGRLIRLADELGIEAVDVDDFIYDLIRADAYNSGEDDPPHGLSAEDEIDAFDDAYEADASSINNGGLEEQIDFMIASLGASQAETELRRIAAEKVEAGD